MIALIKYLTLALADALLPYFMVMVENSHFKVNKSMILFFLDSLIIHFFIPAPYIAQILILGVSLILVKNKFHFHRYFLIHTYLRFLGFSIASLLTVELLSKMQFHLFSPAINEMILYDLILTMFFMITISIRQRDHRKKITYKLYLTVIAGIFGFCFLLSKLYFQSAISHEWTYIILSVIEIALMMSVFSFFREALEQEQIVSHEKINSLKLNHLLEIEEQYHELAKYKHDIKNNLMTLSYLQKEDAHQAESFLNDMLDGLSVVSNEKIICEHLVINALLTRKMQEHPDIQFDINCKCSKNLFVKDLHLNAIFSNLLDNSVEYVSSHDVTKKVSVTCIERGQLLMIQVINPVENHYEYIERPHTTKADHLHHGYGSIIVKDAAKDYDGDVLVSVENQHYIVKVLLKQ